MVETRAARRASAWLRGATGRLVRSRAPAAPAPRRRRKEKRRAKPVREIEARLIVRILTYLTCRGKIRAECVSRAFRTAAGLPAAWPIVDFLELRAQQLSLMVRLWRIKPQLKRLRIHVGYSEFFTVVGLLHESATAHIQRLDVLVQHGGTLISVSRFQNELIDIDNLPSWYADPANSARSELLGVAPRALDGAMDGVAVNVVATCPALKELRLVTIGRMSPTAFYEIGGELDGVAFAEERHESPTTCALDCLAGLRNLRVLETNYSLDIVAHALPNLLALKVLILSTGTRRVSNTLFSSPSLEYFDCSSVSKGVYITGLDCPKLSTLVRNSDGYGMHSAMEPTLPAAALGHLKGEHDHAIQVLDVQDRFVLIKHGRVNHAFYGDCRLDWTRPAYEVKVRGGAFMNHYAEATWKLVEPFNVASDFRVCFGQDRRCRD